MRFEWDSAKSERNLRIRGFDFAFAEAIFAGRTTKRVDLRRDYGELRLVAVGLANSAYLTVVYTDRVAADGETVRRIISARMSSRNERRAYDEDFPAKA